MATRAQILPFEKEGEVGESYPYHENTPAGIIQLWTPDPNNGDYSLKMEAVEEFTGDPNSFYGQYTNVGSDWDSGASNFFRQVKMVYVPEWDALLARTIPDVFADDDWKIIEFGLARFTSGNLISRVRWEHPDGSRWMTAYSWPGCA